MIRLRFFVTILALHAVDAAGIPQPNISNLRASHQSSTNSLLVEWQFPRPHDNVYFTVRYRLGGNSQWQFARAVETRHLISLTDLERHSGGARVDELVVQVQAERAGQVIEDWSPQLIITINRKVAVGGMLLDDDDLLPPLEFTAHVNGPNTVRLEWKPHTSTNKDLYYIVNVKQLTSSSGSTRHNQQIKTAATSFTMGKLISGEKYEMTIRSAVNGSVMSSTAAIVEISMPLAEEFFEIGNLVISSHFNTNNRGSVNLTWDVPERMQNKIYAYDVQYTEAAAEQWEKVRFSGAKPTAALDGLKSNTEYLLRIRTTLANNVQTESAQFRFKTPKVEPNPIQKVDVIYSHDVDSVKLQWILEPHVSAEKVAGYDVYISDDLSRPDSQWRLIRLENNEASLSLHDLKSSTVYYVRVNVRNLDGSSIRAPTLFRFKTFETSTSEKDSEGNDKVESNSLSYRNVGLGRVEIKWTFASDILDRVIGSIVLYTDRKDLSPEQWSKVVINDSQNTTVILDGLRPGTRYSVQIIPQMYTGEFDYTARELFELKTDLGSGQYVESPTQYPPRYHPSLGQFQQMTMSETEYMRILSCNPDAISTVCAWDELCIARVEDPKKGWCITTTLRDSILNS